MNGQEPAKRVRFYVNETDRTQGTATFVWIVEFLRKHNAAGVTVFQSTMGFGTSGRIHTAHIVDLAADLPVIVEWIDVESNVAALLPELVSGTEPGMVTVEDVSIALRAPERVRDVSTELTVSTVMSRAPVCVDATAPVRDVVQRMHAQGVRAVPVVQSGTAIGIVTAGDLLTRAGLGVRLSIFPTLQPAEIDEQLEKLNHRFARDIMSSPPVTIQAKATLNRAASVMVHRRLKRLPVVDERETLVGIVSRVDLLRTVTRIPPRAESEPVGFFPNGAARVDTIMRRDVPTVLANTPIDLVMQAVISTRLNLTLVVTNDKRVSGIITGAEILQRVTPDLREGVISTLLHRLPFVHSTPEELESQKHARANSASELMSSNFITVAPTERLDAAVVRMVDGAHKIAAVVDYDGRLLGVIDRADVLRGLLRA